MGGRRWAVKAGWIASDDKLIEGMDQERKVEKRRDFRISCEEVKLRKYLIKMLGILKFLHISIQTENFMLNQLKSSKKNTLSSKNIPSKNTF